MLKISGLVGATAFVAAFLLSGAGTGLSIQPARADDCLAAPKGASPAGQHWYYRIERASRRKCWYLHAAGQPRQHAALRHQAAAAAANAAPAPVPEPQTAAAPAAAPAWPAAPAWAAAPVPPAAPAPPAAAPIPSVPAPESAAGSTPPAPHITVLAVRTATPFASTAPIPQQSTPPQSQSETAPAPQTLPRDESTPVAAHAKSDDAGAAQPQGKADAAHDAAVQTADAANAAAKTRTAEIFILLALVFGLAAALIALVSKIADAYRTPRISHDPDAAWLNYRSAARPRIEAAAGHGEQNVGEQNVGEQNVPFVDPHEHYGLADLHAHEWLDTPAPAQGESPASPRPSRTDIEPALHALRQARQSRVA